MMPVVSPDLKLQEIGVSESLFNTLGGRKVSVLGVGNESEQLLFTPKILPLSSYVVAFHPLMFVGVTADFDGGMVCTLLQVPEEE